MYLKLDFQLIFKKCILIQISPTYVSKSPHNNISPMVEVMAWSCPGDKPLLKPIKIQFTDVSICHQVPMDY